MSSSAAESVYEAFCQTAGQCAANDFLVVEANTARAFGIEAGTRRYGEVRVEVDRLAQRYGDAGYGAGQRIGLLLGNRPAFFLHWFSLNALGASVVPISAELRAAELDYLLAHSELSLAVAVPGARELRDAAARLAIPVVTAESVQGGSLPTARIPAKKAPIGRDTECAVLYTSGTTGRSKGCILSNEYYLQAGRWYNEIGGLCRVRPGAERLITPLPLTHMNAMAYSTMAMLLSGGALVQLDRFHPDAWWQSVRESAATIVHYLGVMPAMLLRAPPGAADRQHAVRFGFGAGVDRRDHAAFEARFGFPLLEAWAMTETGAGAVVIANREPRHVGTACFGKPEPRVEIRVVDDAGQDADVGTPGELWVRAVGARRARGFFTEYLKDAQASEAAWRDGYFHTGDVVRRDGEGHLYFVDRKKNVIRRSGENISAVEVESILMQHPLVKQVAVAATPDALRGAEVLACIVPSKGVSDAELEGAARGIAEYALSRLSYYKAPGYVAFVDSLPLTASEKIQRAQLARMAASLPGTARCADLRALKQRPAER